jgi:transposase, IS5 family
MRQERTIQATIFEVFAQHEIGCELKAMSQWLDGQRQLTSLVAGDLRRQGVRETGRHGLPAESVLRCALLKQQRQLSYEELAFHLEDSASFRAFARLPLRWSPKKSVLHQTIAAIRAATWEAINQALLASAKQDRLESGATVRLDSTVTAALMHEPSDSTLLSDAVRVITRLLQRVEALPGAPAVQWRDRRRLAKKRARAIEYSRGQDKKRQLYRELIAATEASRDELHAMAAGLAEVAEIGTERWRAEVAHYLPLIARVIVQARRRVLDGEIVPASEKLVSLFEPHADIIVKGGRQVQYGHKLNLATGKSGLILDIVIETGNPADAERFVSMLDRHIARTGAPPRQTAADGGYASRANLAAAKARGVADVAFHKKCGIAITEMVKSPWVYRRLRNFRAGIEAAISCFKRAYGAARCTPAFAGAGSGADWTTSRPTSGPPWWRTIWCCSPGSNRLSRARLQGNEKPANHAVLNCPFADSRLGCRHQCAKCGPSPIALISFRPCYTAEKHAFMDAH